MSKEKPSGGSVIDKINPLIDKVRSTRPGAAKESATDVVSGAKSVVQMSIGYLKQETQTPLDEIKKLVVAGAKAAVLFSFGLVMMSLGLLRLVQRLLHTSRTKVVAGQVVHDRSHWSGIKALLPYGVTLIAGIVVILLIAALAYRSNKKFSGAI